MTSGTLASDVSWQIAVGMAELHAVFGWQNHVSAWQETARALVIFVYGYVLVRIGGRRTFARWSAIDIVVAIIIGSNLSRTITGTAPFSGTLLATTAIVGLHWLLTQTAARSKVFSRFLEGRAVVIAEDGKPSPKQMRAHSVSHADIEQALHECGLTEIGEAARITLEPSGKIEVIKKV